MWEDAKCATVLSICGVKCALGRVKLLKKWREFSGGGNDIRFFLKKGNHPHRAEQSRAGSAEQSRAGSAEQSRR